MAITTPSLKIKKSILIEASHHHDSIFQELYEIYPTAQKQLYESKWSFQKESLPKNIMKFQKIVGKESIKMPKIITSSGTLQRVGKIFY